MKIRFREQVVSGQSEAAVGARMNGGKMKTRLIGLIVLLDVAVSASATTYYVRTNGNDSATGTNWDTALLTVSQAVAYATTDGDMILLSNGVHEIASEIFITNGITIKGVFGKDETVVQRNPTNVAYRLFTLSNSAVVIEGIELRNGTAYGSTPYGGAVYMYDGTINDCNLISNPAAGNGRGGAVYVRGGTLSNCKIAHNWGREGGGGLYIVGSCLVSNCLIMSNGCEYSGGGGIQMSAPGALVTHCEITGNFEGRSAGGGIAMSAGTVRNCLIAGNRHTTENLPNRGGGVRQSGGTILSCTIAGNEALFPSNECGGVWWTGGGITNTIIYGNMRDDVPDDLLATNLATISYSCAPELTNGMGNITNDPMFECAATNNYRLLAGSPCINTGTNQAWMIDEVDLDGQARITGKNVDMGCYERKRGAGVVITFR